MSGVIVLMCHVHMANTNTLHPCVIRCCLVRLIRDIVVSWGSGVTARFPEYYIFEQLCS